MLPAIRVWEFSCRHRSARGGGGGGVSATSPALVRRLLRLLRLVLVVIRPQRPVCLLPQLTGGTKVLSFREAAVVRACSGAWTASSIV
jgi:hypothetical protein